MHVWNVVICVFALVLAASAQDKFKPACTSPRYPTPARSGLAIDAQCVIQGASKEVTNNPAEGEQNKAKNNFCAQDPANPVKTSDLKALQDNVQKDLSINFGQKADPTTGRKPGPTTDRSKLRNIDSKLAEGKVAIFTGYVLIARQESAESVNCQLAPAPKEVKGQPKPPHNPADDLLHDIHISLVDSKDTTNECQSIVAEMTPHHRPAEWTEPNVTKVSKAGLQVRVTGQLFFDSAHDLPCVGGQKPAKSTGNPVRLALWEIHPIYKFEVFDADGKWKDLSDWVNKK
jgi:hypothetical protein